jgi:hypothetical protein
MRTNHGILLLAYLALGLPLGCAAAYLCARSTALSVCGIHAQGHVQERGRYGARHWAIVRAGDGQYFDVTLPADMPLGVGAPVDIVYLEDGRFLQRFPLASLIDRITLRSTSRVVEVKSLEESRWFLVLGLTALTAACLYFAARSRRRILKEPRDTSDWR